MTFEKQKHKAKISTSPCDKFCKGGGSSEECVRLGSIGTAPNTSPICQYKQETCVPVQFKDPTDADAAIDACKTSAAELSEGLEAVEEAKANS